MPEHDQQERKSGRFSQNSGDRPLAGRAREDMGARQPEYHETAFSYRQYGNVPQKHDELRGKKRRRYKDMSPEEQKASRRLRGMSIISLLVGFALCGLLLRWFA